MLLLFAVLLAAAEPRGKRGTAAGPPGAPFSVVEATIAEMRLAQEQGRVTSRDLVVLSLTRIAFYEDKLHAAITVNPDALKEAEERDRERGRAAETPGGGDGVLHCHVDRRKGAAGGPGVGVHGRPDQILLGCQDLCVQAKELDTGGPVQVQAHLIEE